MKSVHVIVFNRWDGRERLPTTDGEAAHACMRAYAQTEAHLHAYICIHIIYICIVVLVYIRTVECASREVDASTSILALLSVPFIIACMHIYIRVYIYIRTCHFYISISYMNN